MFLSFLWTYWPYLVPAIGVIVALVVVAIVFKDWRLIGVAGSILAALAIVGRAFAQGSAAERGKVESANADALARRQALDRAAATDSDADLRKELGRYLVVLGVMPILFLLAVTLGACNATTGGKGAGGAFCAVEHPIGLSAAVIAAMSHDELAAAVSHNRHGEAECGWSPPNRGALASGRSA